MLPLGQCSATTFRSLPAKAAARRSELRQISQNDFSRSNEMRFCFIAGGEFSTNELYTDARTPSPGVAAQNTAGDGQRLAARSSDRIWTGPSIQFSAQKETTLSRGHGSHPDRTASYGRRLAALRSAIGARTQGRWRLRGPGCFARCSAFRACDPAIRHSVSLVPARGCARIGSFARTGHPPRMGAIRCCSRAGGRCSGDGPTAAARGDNAH